MQAIVLHCQPGSRFHFGQYAPDRDTDTALAATGHIIHSDTLFAALANNWQGSLGNADELVALFNHHQCNISSGFHCLQYQGQTVWFLPKPISFNLLVPGGNWDYKQYRKISYLSKGIWERLHSPDQLNPEAGILVIGKEYALLPEELPGLAEMEADKRKALAAQLGICHTITLPKVEVRNTGPDSRPYQFSVTEIADNSTHLPGLEVHYYFLLETNAMPAESLQKLHTAIQLLPYNGVGAERSTIGHFEKATIHDNWEVKLQGEEAPLACTLSLFNPTTGGMAMGKPLLRGGRRLGVEGKGQRWLRSVRMMQEGALIHPADKGRLVQVSPDPATLGPFLRHGMALTLPVHQKWIPS
jgi:CRISPR type III-A-associated RAMP protein Csm4